MQLLWYNSEIYIINVIYLVLKLMWIINIKLKLNINLIIINSNSYKIIYKYRLIVRLKFFFFFVYNFSIRHWKSSYNIFCLFKSIELAKFGILNLKYFIRIVVHSKQDVQIRTNIETCTTINHSIVS